MKFISLSKEADILIKKFNEYFTSSKDDFSLLLQKKINHNDMSVLLVIGDNNNLHNLSFNCSQMETLKALFNAWRIFNSVHSSEVQKKKAWRIIDELSTVVDYSGRGKKSIAFLRRFRFNFANDIRYLILLTGNSIYGIPIFKLAILCDIWKIEQGYIPLHAAGVLKNNRLFLFLGPSGSGKSTCASLSNAVGGSVLDEDQVLLYRLDNGQFFADAWGYNIQSCSIPLYAIYVLIQDCENQLIPITASNAVRYLFECNSDVIGSVPSDEHLRHLFMNLAILARQVPAYELHFRKSPEFWQLIDEQFPE